MVIFAITFLSWHCLTCWYSKSQKILFITKGMSLYWAFGHRQIQTLGDVRLILPRFWWSRNSYPIPQPAKEDKPFLHCGSKKSDNNEKREKEFERMYAWLNGLSPPHLKQSLDPLSFLLTNVYWWYLWGGIPLQPSTKTEKLRLVWKTYAKICAFFVTYFNPP